MYKSIVFDLGGVMIDFDPKGYLVDRLCNAETEEEVYDLTFGSEEWKLLDAGLISRFDGNHRMLEKARDIRRFANYYLPDAVKILTTYAKMEQQGVRGENADALRAEVEKNAAAIATAFENQLDALYSAEVLDIGADLDVLKSLMKGQGL